jgi:hypothetical protein
VFRGSFVAHAEEMKQCGETTKLVEVVEQVEGQSEDEIVSSASDPVHEACNVNLLVLEQGSLLNEVYGCVVLGDWLLVDFLVLIAVKIVFQTPMAATQHPLQEHHQLAAALKEGNVFIDEAQLSVLSQLLEARLHDRGHLLQPGNDEADHCFEQVVDDSTVTL